MTAVVNPVNESQGVHRANCATRHRDAVRERESRRRLDYRVTLARTDVLSRIGQSAAPEREEKQNQGAGADETRNNTKSTGLSSTTL